MGVTNMALRSPLWWHFEEQMANVGRLSKEVKYPKVKFNINLIMAFLFREDGKPVYGVDGKLPWSGFTDEVKYFKGVTIGHTVVMGRKTFDSLGNKPLPNRRNIVLTKRYPEDVDVVEGVEYYHSIERVLEAIKDDTQVFIIGGNDIWRAFKEYANAVYVSVINSPSTNALLDSFTEQEWSDRVSVISKDVIPTDGSVTDSLFEPYGFVETSRRVSNNFEVEGFIAIVLHRKLPINIIEYQRKGKACQMIVNYPGVDLKTLGATAVFHDHKQYLRVADAKLCWLSDTTVDAVTRIKVLLITPLTVLGFYINKKKVEEYGIKTHLLGSVIIESTFQLHVHSGLFTSGSLNNVVKQIWLSGEDKFIDTNIPLEEVTNKFTVELQGTFNYPTQTLNFK